MIQLSVLYCQSLHYSVCCVQHKGSLWGFHVLLLQTGYFNNI